MRGGWGGCANSCISGVVAVVTRGYDAVFAAAHALKNGIAERRDHGSPGGGVVKIFLRTGIAGCRPARVALFRRAHQPSLPAGLMIVPAWQAAGGTVHR